MKKNIELFKKIIEEKKSKGNNTNTKKAAKNISKSGNRGSKGVKTGNGGGLFDK